MKRFIYHKIERLLTSLGNFCFDLSHHFEYCEDCGRNRWRDKPCKGVTHDF